MKVAAAYIRRSSVSADSPGDASREAQLAAVRSMCGQDVEVYSDWGISGQRDDRPDYLRLKADVASGKVGSICAYSLSRLGRSARELLAFVDLCQQHGVTIRTSVESLDTSSAMGRAMLTVMAAFAQLEADTARERQASARAARVARGDDMSAGYGYRLERQPDGRLKRVTDDDRPASRVVDAYREAGSVLGACRKLREWGIPAPRGGERWATFTVQRILEAQAPELLPRRSSAGRRTPGTAPLAQLLRCPFCGRFLTPNLARGQYYCANGRFQRELHPRYAVREVDVLPWVQAEAERFDPPGETIAVDGIEAKRDAIDGRLERARELYIAGEITRDRFEEQKEQAARDRDALTAESSVVGLAGRAIAWDGDPAKLNGFLRAILVQVDLNDRLLPVRAQWRVPEWRKAD